MAKIIEMNFGNRDEGEDGKEFDNYLNNDSLIRILGLLTGFRRAQPNSFLQENVNIRQAGIKDCADNQLYTWINRASVEDVKIHPSFYDAIIAELRKRNLIRN